MAAELLRPEALRLAAIGPVDDVGALRGAARRGVGPARRWLSGVRTSRPVTARAFVPAGSTGGSCWCVDLRCVWPDQDPSFWVTDFYPSRDRPAGFYDASAWLRIPRAKTSRLRSLIGGLRVFDFISWSRKLGTLTTLGMCPELPDASVSPGALLLRGFGVPRVLFHGSASAVATRPWPLTMSATATTITAAAAPTRNVIDSPRNR